MKSFDFISIVFSSYFFWLAASSAYLLSSKFSPYFENLPVNPIKFSDPLSSDASDAIEVESTPPLTYAPTGTSLLKWIFTDSFNLLLSSDSKYLEVWKKSGS